MHAKQQSLKTAESENIDAATYKCFFIKAMKNVTVTGFTVLPKALESAKTLKVTTFQTSDR